MNIKSGFFEVFGCVENIQGLSRNLLVKMYLELSCRVCFLHGYVFLNLTSTLVSLASGCSVLAN